MLKSQVLICLYSLTICCNLSKIYFFTGREVPSVMRPGAQNGASSLQVNPSQSSLQVTQQQSQRILPPLLQFSLQGSFQGTPQQLHQFRPTFEPHVGTVPIGECCFCVTLVFY